MNLGDLLGLGATPGMAQPSRSEDQASLASIPNAASDPGWQNAYAEAKQNDPSFGSFSDFINFQRQAIMSRLGTTAQPQAGLGGLSHGGLKVGSPIRNFLGAIGDALLVANGHDPVYQKRLQQQRQQNALQGFLTDPDAAIAQLMQVDAPSAVELYTKMHHQEALPDAIQTYEYRNHLPESERPAFDEFQRVMHPGLFTPVTLGPNDTVEMPGAPSGGSPSGLPHVSDQKSYDAVPPGSQYVTPDGHIRVKGGQTASPSGNFPR